MAATANVSEISQHGLHNPRDSNPFATPTSESIDLPIAPEQAAAPWLSSQRHSPNGYTNATATDHEQDFFTHKLNSISSSGRSSIGAPERMTAYANPASNVVYTQKAQEKLHNHEGRTARHSREVRRQRRDPEKMAGFASPVPSALDRRHVHQGGLAYLEDDGFDDVRLLQEKKAVNILLFLSGPCAILSMINALWTLVALVITTLSQPVRICARRPTFGQQLAGLLGPALNLHLKSIYTPLPPHADEDSSYNTGMLLLVHSLSPFFSLGLALAAWVVAVYWLSSAVVGDPSGTDRRDDGKETCLALRNWWERWLVKSIREE